MMRPRCMEGPIRKLGPVMGGLMFGAVLLVPACAPTTPRGYVALEDPREPIQLDAVASSGNRFQVEVHDNPEGADLAFWVDAIQRELVHGRGYELKSSESIEAEGGTRGHELQFRARHQLQSYLYLLAVFVEGDEVLVCEAGGTEEDLEPDLEALRAAIRELGS